MSRQRGRYSTDELRQMAKSDEIRPDIPVGKGGRKANQSIRHSFVLEEARRARSFLEGFSEEGRGDGVQRSLPVCAVIVTINVSATSLLFRQATAPASLTAQSL